MTTQPLEIEREQSNGQAVLRLRGDCLLDSGEQLWNAVERETERGVPFLVDLTEVARFDGACAALLHSLESSGAQRGAPFELIGAGAEADRLLELYKCPESEQCGDAPVRRIGLFDQVGRSSWATVLVMKDVLIFIGDLAFATRQASKESRSIHWAAVPRLMERAGADGIPIILLINFLVGLIIALQSAFQLERFGANLFIADLVGLSVVREMAPLMTAIVVAGRSGAAYAAELGSMKVSQEVDALWTLGFDPQRFLVLPRLIALALVVPILTTLSMVVGIFGGLIIGVQYLGLTTLAFMVQLGNAVGFSDLAGGLLKSSVFAVAIGLIACQRGLATRGGAAEVGNATTSSVVATLFSLVILDTVFTLGFNLFGI